MNICLYNTIQYMPKCSTVLPLERKEDLNVLSYTLIFGTIFYYCNTLLSYFFSRRLYRTACAVWEHFRKSSADIFFAADHNVCITSRLLWTGICLMELLLSDAYYFMSCDERKKVWLLRLTHFGCADRMGQRMYSYSAWNNRKCERKV